MPEFIEPRFDPMFKRIFADPNDPGRLQSFLGTVLDIPADDLTKLTFTDTHLHPTYLGDKESIVDVRVSTLSGRDIDVEIQLADQPGFRDRLAYYVSRMLASHLRSGDSYQEMAQAIGIAITGFSFLHDPGGTYHHRFRLHDSHRDLELTDVVEINVLELPKLPRRSDQSLLWNWLHFIAAETQEELDMVDTTNPVIADAVEKVRFFNHDESMRILYEQHLKYLNDKFNIEQHMREKAEAEGMAKGMAEGMAQGLAEGMAEGVARGLVDGAEKTRNALAQRLLARGFTVAEVADLTQLSIDEVSELNAAEDM